MSDNTKYVISADGAEVDTRSRKDAAVTLATEYHLANPGSTVTVVTDAGNEVFRQEPAVSEDAAVEQAEEVAEDSETPEETAEAVAEGVKRFKPWSRVEEVTAFDAPELENATLAYSRTRTKTAIYRKNDKSGWIILDTRTGEQWEYENTHDGRMKVNELQDEYRRQVAQEREAAEAARKEAIAAKKAAQAEAKTQAEAEKAAAKAEREAKREAKKLADEQAKLEKAEAKAKAKADAEVEVEETVNA